MAINNKEDGLSVRNKLNTLISDVDTLKGANPSNYTPQGSISVAADFPLLTEVEAGYLYVIEADVTDNDVTKTNTGQSFLEGVSIVWSESGEWLDLGSNYITQDQIDKIDLGANFVGHIDLTTAAITPFEGATVTPDEDGVYPNYNSLERKNELCNFIYTSGAWVKKIIKSDISNDNKLFTSNSLELVTITHNDPSVDVHIPSHFRVFYGGYFYYINTDAVDYSLSTFECLYVNVLNSDTGAPIDAPKNIIKANWSTDSFTLGEAGTNRIILAARGSDDTLQSGLLVEAKNIRNIQSNSESIVLNADDLTDVNLELNGLLLNSKSLTYSVLDDVISITLPSSIRLFDGVRSRYVTGSTALSFTLATYEALYVDLDNTVSDSGDIGSPLTINKTSNFTASSFLVTQKDTKRIILLAKGSRDHFVGGVLMPFTTENVIDKKVNIAKMKPYAIGTATVYEGDTKSTDNFIVNAVSYPNGVIVACRNGGDVVRIALDGTETTLMTIAGASDWRLMFLDSNLNLYVSPHASATGSITTDVRGLYKLTYGQSTFVKVIDLDDGTGNDDTFWTMGEDEDGRLYTGVYAHTVRQNADIWKSIDGGNTWFVVFDFLTLKSNAMHVHCLYFCPWQKALYAIIGEINTIWKSTDHGITWEDLNIVLTEKGTMIYSTPFARIIGSDGPYNLEIDITTDDINHETVFKGSASTCFAFRTSDITGFIYAFCKIDSSVTSASYYPPIGAIDDDAILQAWKDTNPNHLAEWEAYHASVSDEYPQDDIRPQNIQILVSKDGGYTWEMAYRYFTGSAGPYGFWTTGQFRNGEILTGRNINNGVSRNFVEPLVFSEGKQKYTVNGINLDGDVFIKTNTSNYISETLY